MTEQKICHVISFLFLFRATHNLYQLVKRHQKQAAQAEETPDQLNQVYPSLSLISLSISCLAILSVCYWISVLSVCHFCCSCDLQNEIHWYCYSGVVGGVSGVNF